MRQRFDARPSYAERCGERRRNFYRGFVRHARFQRNAKSGLRGFDRIGGKRFAYRGFSAFEKIYSGFFFIPPCNGLFEGVQDERNFIGEAAAQIISQEKDLILFGYDYWDEDAGHRCEMQLEDMATSIRDRLPLKDRDHSVFPFRRR